MAPHSNKPSYIHASDNLSFIFPCPWAENEHRGSHMAFLPKLSPKAYHTLRSPSWDSVFGLVNDMWQFVICLCFPIQSCSHISYFCAKDPTSLPCLDYVPCLHGIHKWMLLIFYYLIMSGRLISGGLLYTERIPIILFCFVLIKK